MSELTRMSPTEKQKRYRDRLRSQGLRPVQIWVPDTKASGFAEECRRQARRLNATDDERDVQDFIEDVADWDGE